MNKNDKARFANQVTVLNTIYSSMEVGVETKTSVKTIAALCGINPWTVNRTVQTLVELGCMKRAISYHGDGQFRVANWTLLTSYDQAFRALQAWQSVNAINGHTARSSGGQKGIQVVKQRIASKKEALSAPTNLVINARNYQIASQALDLLKEANIPVDETAFFASMGIEHSESVEAITQILPLINSLEATIKSLKAERKAGVLV